MRRKISLLAGAIFLAAAGVATAQDVIIAPDQEIVIREYVIAHPVEPVETFDGIAVGQQIPPEVTLYPIDSPDMMYSYVTMDNQTLIVDSETREIVRILQ